MDSWSPMNKSISRRIGFTALAVFVLAGFLLPLMPTAQAQSSGQFKPSLELRIESQPTVPIVPNGAPQPIVVRWTYTFKEQTTTAPTVVTTSTTIKFTPAPVCAAPGLIITGPPSVSVTFSGAGANAGKLTYTDIVTFSVVATQEAPGETPTECTFAATADAVNSQIIATEAAPVKATVVVAYYGLVSSNVPTTIDEAGPQKQITYSIELTNNGNARSNVNFNVVDTHSADGWNPIAPNQILLESKNQGGTATTKNVNFLVSTPYKNGWNNKETTFVLKIQPVSTNNPELKGSEIQVNVLARVRGIYVPGPEPALLGLAIIGTAFLLRLRKDDE